MAPKKAARCKAVQGDESASSRQGGLLKPALDKSHILNEEGLNKVRQAAASKTNEWSSTKLKQAGAPLDQSGAHFYPIFLQTLFAGLGPPFSNFFRAVLEFYEIQLLHLHPNSVLILSIFAYLCEAYLGVRPSVAVFRHFYSLHLTAGDECSGCASFRFRDSSRGLFIPISRTGGNAVTSVTTEVEGFRSRWFFVDAGEVNAHYEVPDAPPAEQESWASVPLVGAGLVNLAQRLTQVREAGLTGQMVAKDFVARRLAPLQAHGEPMWMLSGREDKMRLNKVDLAPEVVNAIMEILFSSSDIPEPRVDFARAIHRFARTSVLKFVRAMPRFNEWGPEEETPTDPHDAPAPVGDAGMLEAPTGSNAGAGNAPGEPGSSAREAGASQAAPPEREILLIPSSDDEESSRGRYEPRTKAAHDRSAVSSREGTSREGGVEAPQGGAETSIPQPPRVLKRWIATDE